MSRRRGSGRLALLLIAAGVAGLYWYGTQEESTGYDGATAAVTRDSIVESTVVVGRIEPRESVPVRPTISGELTELTVSAGDAVQAGQSVGTVRPIADPVQLANARSRVAQARLRVAAAERELGRRSHQLASGELAVAGEERDRAIDDLAQAREELAAAQREVRLLAQGTSRGRGQASTQIISPVAGTVLDVPVVVGTFVSETSAFRDGTTVVTVADMSDLLFKGQIDETYVNALEVGDELPLDVGALPESVVPSVLEHVAPRASGEASIVGEARSATTYEIWARINAEPSMRAGFSATATVILEQRENVLVVDEGALRFQGDQASVELVGEGGELEMREVELGLSNGVNIEVLAGLSEGDRVALRTERRE
ncbi:MAG: efflux RND transporter periplasmic adaptor subunit [Myxococcota bacterium]